MDLDHLSNNTLSSNSEQLNTLSFLLYDLSKIASSKIIDKSINLNPKILIHIGLSIMSSTSHILSIC